MLLHINCDIAVQLVTFVVIVKISIMCPNNNFIHLGIIMYNKKGQG